MKALFSEDGRLDWTADPEVAKIVIGTLAWDRDEAGIEVEVPADLASRFPHLTHLHLWGITSLESLPPLPAGLKTLDVRRCSRLTAVRDVPASLEVLDCGGCAALTALPSSPAEIVRFFFDRCIALRQRTLENFLAALRERAVEGPPVVEIDGSGCPAVATLEEFPRTLRKLVLAGCRKLESVDGVAEFEQLGHLSLAGCDRLAELPELPRSLQYLELRGADNLTRFLGQDIGPYDRGSEDRPNVATTFHSRTKFGGTLAASAQAKLLLLGDGRVGKTTLTKRLQWDTLTPAQQAACPHLEPRGDEPFGHRVRFSRWETRLRIDEGTAADLNRRASAAGLAEPASDQTVAGAVRIWDFGGQEIYHQTHRLFAAEGSVFLLVWSAAEIDEAELRRQKPADVTDDEWNAWNRRRSLDYWLDYVFSIRPNASVLLVCTHCPRGAPHPPWTERAPRYAAQALECYYIDSLEEACPENPEYRKLTAAIRAKCGAEAARIGILQPAFYADASAYVDELLRANDAARQREERPPHLMLSPGDWRAQLAKRHRLSGARAYALGTDDVASITGYLHDAGQIFHVRRGRTEAIVVDQEWATDLIYEILRPGGQISRVIKATAGCFRETALDDDRVWCFLGDMEKEQLLDYMQQCGILVRLASREQHREGKAVYLATEKWLLPPYEGEGGVSGRLEREMQDVLERPGSVAYQTFSFEHGTVSEFDFRALMAHLGAVLGSRATWFREGMQAIDDPRQPTWCFQVRWTARGKDDFYGRVDARLVAPEAALADLARQVEEAFAGPGSPFARRADSMRRERGAPGEQPLELAWFRDVRDGDYDVAVSSSGADAGVVEDLVRHLKGVGRLRVAWYRLDECRSDENAKVMKFMLELRRPPCILLYLSDAYLRDDPVNNWYCVWELADAILQVKRGGRCIERTLVIYAPGGELDSKNVNHKALDAFRKMEDYFLDKYRDVPAGDRATFRHYNDWALHFGDAAKELKSFYEERGTLGTYSRVEWRDDRPDFAAVLDDVRRALVLGHRP